MTVKKRKLKRSIIKVVSIAVITVSIYMLYRVGLEFYGVIELRQRADEAVAELEKLQAENASLTSTRDKLEDPDYVQTYARGNYMFSKDGETIFYLPGTNPTDDSE